MEPERPNPEDPSNQVERSVRSFYDTYGWTELEGGRRGEDKTYRMFRQAHAAYNAASLVRTAALFPPGFDRLLIAGCGDMPDSHLAIARRAKHVTCIDISQAAIALARQRIAGPMDGHVASILDMPFPDGAFDAVFCAHVLYHIAGEDHERAVRQMIRVTKPGGRVVVLYFNPASPLRAASAVISRLQGLARTMTRRQPDGDPAPALYFAAHRLGWWRRFSDQCTVTLLPWQAMSAKVERNLLWSERIARAFYGGASRVERRFPSLATRLWVFPAVVLDKRA